MANPIPSVMTWEDYQTFVTTLLNGQSVDETLLTQMLNEARTNREEEREWNVLKKVDQSVSWSPSDTWQTAKTLPADFKRWVERNPIQVWDGNTVSPIIIPVEIIPFEDRLFHFSDNYLAAVDYTNSQLYFMGTADKNYTVLLTYMQENGDIVAAASNNNVSTSWVGFPARFHKVLGYDVATMFRLGVSYDDLAARNAENNNLRAETVMKSMRKWDADLQRMNIRNMDYFPRGEVGFINHKINIR